MHNTFQFFVRTHCSRNDQNSLNKNKMPAFYKRYADDTLSKMPDTTAASDFLSALNEIHPSVCFTMEAEDNNKIPFLRMEIIKMDPNWTQRSTRN